MGGVKRGRMGNLLGVDSLPLLNFSVGDGGVDDDELDEFLTSF